VRAYWVLATVIFLNFTAGGATYPFYALYASSLGASLGQVALVVGVQSSVALVSGLLWGRAADRVGRYKPFIVGSMAGEALVSLAIGQVPTWEWLVPLHVVMGLTQGAGQVASLALMGDILDGHPHRGRLISGYRMSGSLAIVASGWVSESVGMRGSFLLASGVYAAAFLAALLIAEPPRVISTAKPLGFVGLMRGPMRPLLILALLCWVPFAAVFSVWPIWIADVLGYGRATFSQLWGIAAFVEVPMMFLAGLMVDRVGRRPTFVLGLVGFCVLYLLYVLQPPLPGLVAAQVLRGVAFALYTATALTMAIELAPPEERGRASGLFTSAQSLAQITGSWIGGPLADAFGFRALYLLSAVAVLFGAAYSFLAIGRGRPARPPAVTRAP
jgi:DHA1 family multidrug resistance protein-like MFS transporter